MSIKDISGFNTLRSLSPETLKLMFEKPDRTVQRVQEIASKALDQLPKASDCGLFLSFYDSIVKLDQEYFARNQTHPFTNLIQRMEAQLPAIKAKGQKIEQKFREKLGSLDSNSPSFKSDMRELRTLLASLSDFGILSPEETAIYEKCFDAIQDRFKAGPMEVRANDIVSKTAPAFKKGLDDAHPFIKKIDEGLTRQMIKSLNTCSKQPMSEMALAIEKKHGELVQDGVQQRVECAVSRIQPANKAFNKEFVQNFIHLISKLENFHIFARSLCEARWKNSVKSLQELTKVPLDLLFALYPNLSAEDFIPQLCAMFESKYLSGLTQEMLSSTALFNDYFNKRDNALFKNLENFYDKAYKEYMLKQHAWFATYAQEIKKPYSQAADIHRNVAEGTCLQNSLDRQLLLLKTPASKAEDIQMGSTQGGRVTQARLNSVYNDAKVGLIPTKEAAALQKKSCERLGLISSDTKPYCTTPKELIKCLSPKENFLGLLSLVSPDGGHAVNVQIDHKRKIFRFIDDNLGIFEMDNYEDFVTAFQTYLESYYPKFNAFLLETFAIQSSKT
ncbi:MAG TPA: hypothetical protein VFU89_00175 [Rhabdochlamydiaceae bacterium]|nr:hypothetical protein [Rhabdochlamydiaceae bacterium]